MSDTADAEPQFEHRPIPVVRAVGWLPMPAGEACEACSVARGVLVMWPCPEIETVTYEELDAELRELTGHKD